MVRFPSDGGTGDENPARKIPEVIGIDRSRPMATMSNHQMVI